MSVWGDIVRCVIDFLKKKICMTTKAVIEKKQLKKLVMQKQSIKKKIGKMKFLLLWVTRKLICFEFTESRENQK